jgi:hypothetical protein
MGEYNPFHDSMDRVKAYQPNRQILGIYYCQARLTAPVLGAHPEAQ